MSPSLLPNSGERNQPTGLLSFYPTFGMGRPRKKVQPKGVLEEQLGYQLRAWMEQALKRYPSQTRQIDILSKRSGVGPETIRQIMNGRQSARVNTLQAITAALGWSLTDLLSKVESAPKPSHELVDVELDGLQRR